MEDKKILESDAFLNLVAARRSVSISMTIVMLVAYFGFILTVAFRKEVFAIKVFSNYLSLGILCGLGLILLAWVMTGIYVLWANKKYDAHVDALRQMWKKSKPN